MKVFWFIYSAFMCAPAFLAAYIFYRISTQGSITFNEPITVIRNTETICALVFALLAIAGWIIASILLFKRGLKDGL